MNANANPAPLSTRSRWHLLLPALLGASATGCTLVFDADELSQEYKEGVEIVASQQCNPIRILVAGEHVYWTTNYIGTKDEACAGQESTAIRRLALGSTGAPQDIATKNLDGATDTTHPWGFSVAGQDLFWVTETAKVCTAKVDDVDQACAPPTKLPEPCKSYGIASARGLVYFHTGDCEGGGGTGIWSYATKDQALSDLKVAVAGTFVVWMGVVPVESPSDDAAWLAWIDKCPDGQMNRMNVARLPNPMVRWSRCTNSVDVRTGAIDEGGLYWTDEGEGALYKLPLPDGVVADADPTRLVAGLDAPSGVALDPKRVYVTTHGLDGAVLHLAKSASPPAEPLREEDLGIVASGRTSAHGGKGVPYRIAAEDSTWLYWVMNEGGNAVERARKPD